MKTTKAFDCVKMMRDIRDTITPAILNMHSEQYMEYFQKKAMAYEDKYTKQERSK